MARVGKNSQEVCKVLLFVERKAFVFLQAHKQLKGSILGPSAITRAF